MSDPFQFGKTEKWHLTLLFLRTFFFVIIPILIIVATFLITAEIVETWVEKNIDLDTNIVGQP